MSNDKHYPLHPNATHPPIMTCEIPLEEYESLKRENTELKAKLEDVEASAYADSIDAGMENRKLKRALWLVRAKNASYNVKNRQRVINTELEQERPDIEFIHHNKKMKQKWMNVERLCLKKAEEYK